jgi:hypothetical protein
VSHLEALIERAKAGQLALLVSVDLPAEATGLPSGKELAHGLAAELNLPATDSLAAVAQGLKARNQQWKYVGYLKRVLPSGDKPGPLHETVASLQLPFLLTAAYDDRLARALAAAGRPANLLIEDGDLERQQPGRPDLIKLCGDLSRAHTLVVAEGEYADLLLDDDRRRLFDRVGEWLREKTVLLLGCDPAETGDLERWLYWEVLERLGAFGGGGYLVWPFDQAQGAPGPAAADVARWAGRGVTVIDAEAVAFLESLAAGLAGVEFAPSPDKEMAALKGLLEMLRGTPTEAQVKARAAEVPAEQRLKSIRVTFRLRLAGDKKLRAALDLEYDPDIDHYTGELKDTGVTLQRLRNWAARAEKGREAWELPQGGTIEQKGIEFFEAILPPGSDERQVYERALYLRQTFADALYVVFEPEDDLGRLSPVPWELLHDGRMALGRGFLGLKYPVYRRLQSVTSPGQVAGRIQKALVVAADPTERLADLDAEVDWLVAALKTVGVAQVDVRRPADEDVSDPEAIKRLLRDGGYHLLHFTGHGQFDDADPSRSRLVLGRARERGKELTAVALAEVARESELILVFLSACQVGGTAEQEASRPWKEAGIVDALTRASVPATVGMRWQVGDQNSHKLAQTFYTELLSGKPAERALMIARQAVGDQPDWVNPVLTKRHGVL